jgi:predicted membrane protein
MYTILFWEAVVGDLVLPVRCKRRKVQRKDSTTSAEVHNMEAAGCSLLTTLFSISANLVTRTHSLALIIYKYKMTKKDDSHVDKKKSKKDKDKKNNKKPRLGKARMVR